MKNRVVLFFGIITIALFVTGIFLLNQRPKHTALYKEANNETDKKNVTVGEDICTEFSKEWVTSALNKPIIKTEKLDSTGLHVCKYFVDENNFVTLRLNNLSAENQKKGQIALGRTITTSESIHMDHFIVKQENGLINNTVLILNPNLFMAVDRSSTKAASDDEIINFASDISNRILKRDFRTSPIIPTEKKESQVPLPQEMDIIRSFFEVIGEGRASNAVMMMTPANTSDDSTKQAWGVQFNAFKSIKVITVEPSMPGDWNDSIHSYKVTLQVEMKPEASSALPIPNYGWENGTNTRWIHLEKINNRWMVGSIATGP